jgi:tetratricopeptide (TPR) repeat protein
MFDEMRKLGQSVSATALMPTLVSQTHLLQTVAAGTGDPTLRDAALVLAARFAEFAGWMAQEDGNNADAERWTDHAVQLAAAGSDHEMAAYALVRRALITLYNYDAVGTISLASRARETAQNARTQGLAAQREAQGHAIAGDYDACFRALELAADLLQASEGADGAPVLGTTNVKNPVGVATGWCLFDLGQPAQAVEILRRELELIPPQARRARSRFAARLALALAGSGELEEACAVAEHMLGEHSDVDSATIRVDLSALSRTLNRWHGQPDVRRVMPRLTEALHTAPAM